METLVGQEVVVERLYPDGTKDCITGTVSGLNGAMLRIENPKVEDLTPEHVLERNGGKYHHGLVWDRPAVWVNTASPVVLSVIEK